MIYVLVNLFLSYKQQNSLDKWNILAQIMQPHMNCQWICATKGLVTYHTIVTFCVKCLLVILIQFFTCKCLLMYFAIISSFCTNFEVLPMIFNTIERQILSPLVVAFKSAVSCSFADLSHTDSDWKLCVPLSVCLIFAWDSFTSNVLWAFGWNQERSLTFSVSAVLPHVDFCLPVPLLCLVADFKLSLTQSAF